MQNIANRYKIVTCHDSRAVEACNNFCIDKGVGSCDTRTFYQHRVRNVGGKLSVKWAPGTSEWLNWQYIQSKGLGLSFTNDLWEYIWNLTKILYVLILIPTVHSGHNFVHNTLAEQLRYVCSLEKKQLICLQPSYYCVSSRCIWRHHLETLFTLLVLSEANPSVPDGFPSYRASNVEFWYFLSCVWTSCWTNRQVASDGKNSNES